MAIRTTMETLIAEVRLMIADTDVTCQQFTDTQIQQHLDATRDDVRYEQLTPAPSIVNLSGSTAGGSLVFADYYSTYQWWEGDVVIQDPHFAVLTPAASDLIVGHWQFQLDVFTTGTPPGQYPPLFATGKTYDLNLAAATLLEFWAATAARAYDFSADGASFRRSQMQVGLLKQADYYRRHARARAIQTVRSDIVEASHTEHVPLLGSNDSLIKG